MPYLVWIIILLTVAISPVVAQNGAGFELAPSVLAGGGNTESTGGQFKIAGTVGQPAAGAKGAGSGFVMYDGFWTPEPFAPTASFVSVSGRVEGASGIAFSRAFVTLTDAASNVQVTVRTDKRGYFIFDGVQVGRFYIVSANRKGYSFSPDNIPINVVDEVNDLVFEIVSAP